MFNHSIVKSSIFELHLFLQKVKIKLLFNKYDSTFKT